MNILAIIVTAVLGTLILANKYVDQKIVQPSPTPEPTATIISPYEEPTETPTPTVPPKVYAPTATPDPDPIVDCKFTYVGIKQLRKSICSKSTDCQIGSKWIYYDSVDKCRADQDTYWKNYSNGDNNKPRVTTQTNTESLVTCVLSFGTHQLTQSDCDLFKKNDVSFNNQSAIVTPDPAMQQQLQAEYQQYLQQSQTPTPIPDNSYNQQQNSQCKTAANNWYTNQGTQCSGSCAQAAKQIAYPEYQQKLKDCDSLYPI